MASQANSKELLQWFIHTVTQTRFNSLASFADILFRKAPFGVTLQERNWQRYIVSHQNHVCESVSGV
jgi:hypothetical protein